MHLLRWLAVLVGISVNLGAATPGEAQAVPDRTGPHLAGPDLAGSPAPEQTAAGATAAWAAWRQSDVAGETPALGSRVAALLQDPAVARAHWGIAVAAMDGTPLYGFDEAKSFRPASTAKLFTTAVAMAVLGPGHTVATEIRGDLDIGTGTIVGDLVLLGGGDASFGTDDVPYRREGGPVPHPGDLARFADQLVAKGVRHITGNIVGNDALFGQEPPPEGWAAEDLLWGYGALPSALSIGDNALRLTITPGNVVAPAPGTDMAAKVEVEQLVAYERVAGAVITEPPMPGPRGTGPHGTEPGRTGPVTAVTVSAMLDQPRVLHVGGRMAADAAPIVEHIAIADVAQYAAEALRGALLARGVQIDGVAQALHTSPAATEPYLQQWRKGDACGAAYPGEGRNCAFSCFATPFPQQVLGSQTSASLADEVTFTLKTSANLHAEVLPRQLALKNACPGGPAVNGASLIRTALLHAGLAEGDFVFYDGSGLSTKDLVTPRAEVQLLAYAAQQPWFPLWKAALPVGGVDGTLAARFTQAPLKGHVFAKTGSLGESRALAGYVQCASGRTVIFAILDDDHEPGSTADRVAMDKIVEAVAAAY